MQDAQFPPDGDEGNGDQSRRAGLRLRDAESVATTRRDMFGDGSLVDTLAGSPPALTDGHDLPDQHPPETTVPGANPSAAPSPSEAPQDSPAAADTSRRAARKKPEPRIANPASSPFAQVPQSLDSIIDSFASEPGSQDQEPSGAEPAVQPLPPVQPPMTAPARLAVSSIFDSLGADGQAVDGASAAETFGPDMSMLGPPLPRLGQARTDAADGILAPDSRPEMQAGI